METKYIDFKAEIKASDAEGGRGKVVGFASVYGVIDSYAEVVEPGAFTRSLKEYGMPSMLLQHKPEDIGGIWIKAEDTSAGLKLEGEMNLDVQKAKEAHSLAKQGALKGLSIGFRTRQAHYDDEGIRHLTDVDLMEVSLVTFPANRQAMISAVKSAASKITTEREFENFLRDAGFSKSQAATIVSKGYKAIDRDLRDADEDEVATLLKSTLSILNGEHKNA